MNHLTIEEDKKHEDSASVSSNLEFLNSDGKNNEKNFQKSKMLSEQIRYYRYVLSAFLEEIPPNADSRIRLQWTSGNPEKFENQRMSHKYAEKVYFNLLEGRMQLGNSLKCLSDTEDPYRKYELKRLAGESEKIAEPVDQGEVEKFPFPDFDTKIEFLDYLRQTLDEMSNKIRMIIEDKRNGDIRTNIHLKEALSSIILGKNYCGKILGCIRNIKNIKDNGAS